MRSTHLKVCSLSWPPYCQFWQGLQGPKDPANDHNQVLILSGNRFCSHHSRNFPHFLFNFTYVVFPREGLGGGYRGPGCCQIDHLCLFSSSVRPLSKSWQSIGSQSSWRSLLWCVRGAGPCIDNCELHSSSLSHCALQVALSGATNVNHIENINQALLCMM